MDYQSIKLSNYDDLVKLPWFEKNGGGEMRVKPGSGVPPIIDGHTHLGWSYLGGRVVKYDTLYPKVKFYYDYDKNPINWDRDEHPIPAEANALTLDIALTPVRCSPYAATHTAANMVKDMDLFGVVGTVILPIEVPFRSRHAYQSIITCAKYSDRLIPFAAVHPWTRFKKLRMDWQVSQGAVGLKVHPEFQFSPPDTKGSIEAMAMAAERGLVVLGHSGSTGTEPPWMQKLSAPERYIPALKALPNLKLILGHTAIKYYERALEVAKQFPEQVWLETSGQGVPILQTILDSYDKERVLYGSDWTFFPFGVPIARSMVALDKYPQEIKENYFYKNAARLLGYDIAAAEKGKLVRSRPLPRDAAAS